MIWVPLTVEESQPLANQFSVSSPQAGWSCLTLDSPKDLDSLEDLLRKAYDCQKATRAKSTDTSENTDAAAEESSLSPAQKAWITRRAQKTDAPPADEAPPSPHPTV
jgi:hypothetical protein